MYDFLFNATLIFRQMTYKSPHPDQITVLGIPYDQNSSFLRGPALAPPRIREAFYSPSANLWTENGVDLGTNTNWHFIDDLADLDPDNWLREIEVKAESLLKGKNNLVALGGDHSITHPLIRAYSQHYPDLTLLQLDAHPDLYDQLDGNHYSHACPFARIMEEGLVQRLVQVGVRTLTGHQQQQAQRFDVEIIQMREIKQVERLSLEGPVYLSLDMDCLDPAFAPGVSHHEPGGMSTRQVLELIQTLGGSLVGADIVEYNPERDPLGITGMAAAKLLKEILAVMLNRSNWD